MSLISRLSFALAACLLLSNCGLIGTALRLAPLAMLVADNGKDGVREQVPSTMEVRGRQVVGNGNYAAKTRRHASTGPQLVLR